MQMGLDLGHELVVDLFAGGGGASLGMEQALGRPVDVAVNHDGEAVAMHMINHPATRHFCEDVFRVDPVAVTNNQPVGLLWASPDCKHFSKAKGGRPVSKKIRGLAWVVVRWLRRNRPRVMALENVEEFADWGPVLSDGRPCPDRKGQTFRQFIAAIKRLGYRVDWRELRASDYGAPTIRKRLFLVARRDGLPIVWPEPTHGDPASIGVKSGRLKPWRTAADCIDWSIPAPSIFERERPLAPATMERIRKGVARFVLEDPQPFLVDELAGPDIDGSKSSLVAAFMEQANTGLVGHDARKPLSTIVGKGSTQRLVAVHLLNLKGSTRRARPIDAPAPTTTAGGNHAALVAAFLAPYYGSGSGLTGRSLEEPAPTVTSRDRLQLITVTIDGSDYAIVDVGMRMLQPRELYRCQGFPDSYVIDRKPDGSPLPKYAQTRMCGNSVSPVISAALVRANFAHEAAFNEALAG